MDNVTKQKIIESNKKLGLNTEFIKDEDVLGYSLGNTIYINESIEQDYERTNKHELLHFFSETEAFKKVKQGLFDEFADRLEEIRDEYELRYFGLYSEAEIEAGALDDEIAIDLMVDNSTFEYEDGLKLGDMCLGQVEQELEEKRYLNLSLNANIKKLDLKYWEKIFVLNYYDGKERILPQGKKGKDKIDAIREDIKKYLEELSNISKEDMQIYSDSPEVIRKYESEIKALESRGESSEQFESDPEGSCSFIAEKLSETLYAEYRHIVDLMSGLDEYKDEQAFKCMMLRETLTQTYKKEQSKKNQNFQTIVAKRDLHRSIASHMILTKSTLKTIYEKVNINQNGNINFKEIYFAAVDLFKDTVVENGKINFEGVETYGKGQWIKFDEKNSNPENYIDNVKKLSALVQNTPWCTKTGAASQLAEGDFYVFVDDENNPHIAVKMTGASIDEVRGIKNGDAQELEDEYREVALSFLENNKEIENGTEWYNKEEWNKRLISYKKKIEEGSLSKEDVPQFIEDYLKKDYKNHDYHENSNRIALIKVLQQYKNNVVGCFAEYYECKEEEIYIGDFIAREHECKSVPYKVIFGDADFCRSEVEDLGQLEIIELDAIFVDSKVKYLGSLKRIGKNVWFENSNVEDLGLLESIGGDAYFWWSSLDSLGNLKYIGGTVFDSSSIRDLGSLEIIGGQAFFNWSNFNDLGNIKSINGSSDLQIYQNELKKPKFEVKFEIVNRNEALESLEFLESKKEIEKDELSIIESVEIAGKIGALRAFLESNKDDEIENKMEALIEFFGLNDEEFDIEDEAGEIDDEDIEIEDEAGFFIVDSEINDVDIEIEENTKKESKSVKSLATAVIDTPISEIKKAKYVIEDVRNNIHEKDEEK